tara:strand:+ start:2357 stop:3421 length:1065 start_codon:yes stop_codon:yes gene_type:complete
MLDKLMFRKKPCFSIITFLKDYLELFSRYTKIPIEYKDLLTFHGSTALMNKKDNDSLWVRVFYSDSDRIEIDKKLKEVYSLLHSDGSNTTEPYLNIDAVDYCTFGNSKPFRIKVRNIINDNFTYFYIKKGDASRIYGLELEHMLSPYNLNFLVYQNTLIEEHIAGIPGDDFINEMLIKCSKVEKNQIAKSFVKFNERCMIRLLGDMRSYNYVITPIHDFDKVIYKIRSIDFDQQSFEGNLKVYRPQFFKENLKMVELVKNCLSKSSVDQYKIEERAIVARRILSNESRLTHLLKCMLNDHISTKENIFKLRNEIFKLTSYSMFKKSNSMGEILKASFNFIKRNYENHQMLSIRN